MAQVWTREPQLLESLDLAVTDLLGSQKPNGQFGTEPWISTDQNVLLALAAAWSLEDSAHFHSEQVLGAIVRGGDALIAAQDEKGMFTFLKKDYSTWGQIFMPWVYSRWMRAYGIVREAMDNGARARWDKALTQGYEGIAATAMGHVHNIPAHHAMGLYAASQVFGRADWQAQAGAFMRRVASEQSPHGWWAEHKGPVVAYNFVYVEALGVYYAMSGDGEVLQSLRSAAQYHAGCTYPDGSPVEVVDGRNPYHAGVRLGNVGFAHTKEGRGFLAQQHGLFLAKGRPFDADYAAQMLLYGCDGEMVETAAAQERHAYRMDDKALMLRRRPWFVALSAFACEIPQNRWGQDRQNFVSVFHDDVGLILGGGNTKLQPLWSTFTVGDSSLLRHEAGDENPDFSPRKGLLHVPDAARIEGGDDAPVLVLIYGEETCRVQVTPEEGDALTLGLSVAMKTGQPVEAHVTLIPHLGQPVASGAGRVDALGEDAFDWANPGWIEHAGWRLTVPEGARLCWPALPHNPYRKDGAATIGEGRMVIVLPFSKNALRREVRVSIV